MTRHLLTGLAVALLLAADAPQEDATKKDLQKMQGNWAVRSMIRDGRKSADDEAQVLFRTVKGNEYTVFHFEKPISKGTFRLDATKRPRTIDAIPASAQADAPPLLGIYEFDGESYQVCFALPGKERPTDFSCKAGSAHTLTVWEREKK